MTGPDEVPAVHETCELIAAGHGLEVVEVQLNSAAGNRVLSVTLDRLDGPVSLEQVAQVSEEISRALDIEDPIEGRYTLEVSSAGIERALVRPKDYRRFAGREVNVKCTRGIEGRRNFRGTITSAGDESFVLQAEDAEVVEIPYTAVGRTKLVVDWDAVLREGSKKDFKEQFEGEKT